MARTDAERLDKLKGIRDSIEDRLGEMASKPRPTYDVDGQKFDFTQYQEMLSKQLKEINEAIKELEDKTDASGGFEETQVFV